jgi:heterodisulfide reductase subunit C
MWVYRIRNGDGESVRGANAIWLCVGCFCCEARCPRGVKPAHLAEEARSHKGFLLEDIVRKPDDKMPQQLFVAALRKVGRL